MKFIPYEFPRTLDGQYIALQPEDRILFTRRDQLQLSQRQLAKLAHVQLRQIQRLESGESHLADCSMATGLAICAALMLDPYYLVPTSASQPDEESLLPAPALDDVNAELKPHHGRKAIRRDIMTVYFNHPRYSIMLPREVLESIGSPDYVRMMWNEKEYRILFQGHLPADTPIPAAELESDWFDVPQHLYDAGTALVFPMAELIEQAATVLSWDDYVYAVECRSVQDKDGSTFILCDLNTAVPSDSIKGPFVVPTCIDDGEED